jgi:hypothetical protein
VAATPSILEILPSFMASPSQPPVERRYAVGVVEAPESDEGTSLTPGDTKVVLLGVLERKANESLESLNDKLLLYDNLAV